MRPTTGYAPTIDRINGLLRHLNLPPAHTDDVGGIRCRWEWNAEGTGPMKFEVEGSPGHRVLDIIDKHVGIDTRRTFDTYSTELGFSSVPAPLGNRLRRLERHVYNRLAPAFFHLGAEAEKAA